MSFFQGKNLIGNRVTVGSITVTVRKLIGEGGYAYVYRCDDSYHNVYALKYVKCLPNLYDQFLYEVHILQQLAQGNNPHIVKYVSSAENPSTNEILLLLEYCPVSAISILQNRELSSSEILIFFIAAAEAIAYLHSQSPPLWHRDMKPENLLVSSDGVVRLCDFGSSTTIQYSPQNAIQGKDDIESNTTPAYRSPEFHIIINIITIGRDTLKILIHNSTSDYM